MLDHSRALNFIIILLKEGKKIIKKNKLIEFNYNHHNFRKIFPLFTHNFIHFFRLFFFFLFAKNFLCQFS